MNLISTAQQALDQSLGLTDNPDKSRDEMIPIKMDFELTQGPYQAPSYKSQVNALVSYCFSKMNTSCTMIAQKQHSTIACY